MRSFTITQKMDWLVWLAVMMPLTSLFWLFDWDIAWANIFYVAGEGWVYGEGQFWKAVRTLGVIPGMLLVLTSLVLISLSYWSERWLTWRKPAVMMVIVVAIGPGILVNLIFKDNWGRPRPRDVIELGGKQQYVKVWQMGEVRGNKSFPCGHCSMGYLLAIPFLFLRHGRRGWSMVFLVGGISFGLLMSYARLLAGAHFPSDALWSFGMVWFAGLVAYGIVRPDIPTAPKTVSEGKSKSQAKRVTLVVGILLPVLIISLMLATPYISGKKTVTTQEQLANTSLIAVDIEEGDLALTVGNDGRFEASYHVNAFGLPLSKIGYQWQVDDTARYTIRHSGWFSEVRNDIKIKLPSLNANHYLIKVRKGTVHFGASRSDGGIQMAIEVEDGDVNLSLDNRVSATILYEAKALNNQTELDGDIKVGSGMISNADLPILHITVVAKAGTLTLEND